MNTKFKKSLNMRWTWRSSEGVMKYRLDYFTTNDPKNVEDVSVRNLSYTSGRCKVPKKWCYAFVVVALCALYFYCSLDNSLLAVTLEQDTSRTTKSDKDDNIRKPIGPFERLLEQQYREAIKWDKGAGCKIPQLDPFSNDIAWTYKKLPPLKCKGQDWVKCYHSRCRVVDEIKKTVEDIECIYTLIIYVDDYTIGRWTMTVVPEDGIYELTESDHVSVNCTGTKNGKPVKWSGNTLGFRPVSMPPVPTDQSLNVVILAFDSTPRTGFIRLMPKSWKVLNEELNATVMEGYNILGDGTSFALFPLLTGKTELELPDVRTINNRNNRTLDDFPFIFKTLKEEAYRTAYFEDMPLDGTFQYRYNGFKQQPADHYLRAFHHINYPFEGWNYCYGDTPQFKMMLNITEQFLELDGRRFVFTIIADISHDNFNDIQLADDDTAAFLRRLIKRTEDTLIIVMGDHGPRYSTVRNKHSIRGKLDEQLPLLAIRLPSRLTRARPGARRALAANSRALTTVHDLHATILDALGMRRHWNPYKVEGADLKRGLTMLEPIPSNRSCTEAGIEPHWCSCLVWEVVLVSDPLFKKTAKALIDYINFILKDAGSQCLPRSAVDITWVNRWRPKSILHSRKLDNGGHTVRFNGKTGITSEFYQIELKANPGGARYEATLMYHVKRDEFVVKTSDISRINSYKNESACITESYPHLAAYCYCEEADLRSWPP